MGRIPIRNSLTKSQCHLNQKRKKSVLTVANGGKPSLHNVELVVALSMSPTLMRSIVKNVDKSCRRKRKMRTPKKKVKTSRMIQTAENISGNQENAKTNLSQNVARADVMPTAAQDVSSTGTAPIAKLRMKQTKKFPKKIKVPVRKADKESADAPNQVRIAVPKVHKKVAMKKKTRNEKLDMASNSKAVVPPDALI